MINVYEDKYGVKYIAPYTFSLDTKAKENTINKALKSKCQRTSNFDETPLDVQTTTELQYQRTENLENMYDELAKTPSTQRKGVYQNG